MNYGLSDNNLNTICEIFKKYSSLRKVILYGSRAMGNYKNGSDIDITLETDENFTRSDFLRLCSDLSESNIPFFVDCSLFSGIQNKDLKEHILRVGKVLYQKEK